jgi:hypothetical protein
VRRVFCASHTSKPASDPADSNKKGIVHVANTEQRIRFTEVQLKPKQTTADGDEGEDPKATAKVEELFKVDNITGKNGPLERRIRARRPRKERPQPEVQDSGGTDAVVEGVSIEENAAPEVEGEKAAEEIVAMGT